MSELKCPFCGDELAMDYTGVMYCCNQNCGKSADWYGSKILWQELIRTRKALDVAKDKLDTVRQYHRGTAVIGPDDIAAYCDKALDKITALEQKDK